MQLSTLLEALRDKEVLHAAEANIGGIAYDSRHVEPGHIFVAVPGFHVDGHSFVGEAVAKGAAALVVHREKLAQVRGVAGTLPIVAVPNPRHALALLSAAFYGYPSRKLRCIGITGTKGKTTVTHLASDILEGAGYSTGLIGTVNFKVGSRTWANDSRQTTPESPEVQQLLAQMVKEGVDYAVIEATSHALALDRVTGCDFDAAVFTNVSSDHLDFHGSYEQYLQDKARLLLMLSQSYDKGIPKAGILNADDPSFSYLREVSPVPLITYGVKNDATVVARDVVLSGLTTQFTVVAGGQQARVSTSLAGSYNVYNCLAALAVGYSQGIDLEPMAHTLRGAREVAGRMEVIDLGQPFGVIVDYAHTPESLERVLEVLRPLTLGRIIAVFGCAGERDKGRRFGMGRVAAKLADYSIFTNEDPRSEDPTAILEDIATGAGEGGGLPGRHYELVVDRRQAIEHAFRKAAPGDLVLLAGKGHEQSILIGDRKLPWDDRQVARELLEKLRRG